MFTKKSPYFSAKLPTTNSLVQIYRTNFFIFKIKNRNSPPIAFTWTNFSSCAAARRETDGLWGQPLIRLGNDPRSSDLRLIANMPPEIQCPDLTKLQAGKCKDVQFSCHRITKFHPNCSQSSLSSLWVSEQLVWHSTMRLVAVVSHTDTAKHRKSYH